MFVNFCSRLNSLLTNYTLNWRMALRNIFTSQWPEEFAFDTDPLCQAYFKPFIDAQLERLKALDALRLKENPNTNYIFYEHTQRVADRLKQVALHCGASAVAANNMALAALLHDIGKAELSPETWHETSGKPSQARKDARRTHAALGANFIEESFNAAPDNVRNHRFLQMMIDMARYHHEDRNGTGPEGARIDWMPHPVRLLSVVEAHDGYTIRRAHFPPERDTSPRGALQHMKSNGVSFDLAYFTKLEEVILAEDALLTQRAETDYSLATDAAREPHHDR